MKCQNGGKFEGFKKIPVMFKSKNDGFSAEVVVVMCTLIKKIIIIKLLGYGQFRPTKVQNRL